MISLRPWIRRKQHKVSIKARLHRACLFMWRNILTTRDLGPTVRSKSIKSWLLEAHMFNWTAFLTYIIVMSVTPGPNNILSMTHASRMGLKKSYPFNLGVFAGAFVVMLLCTFFSNLLYSYIPKVATIMLFIGASYMLYLAYKIFTSGKELKPSRMTDARFSTAVLLQFINPKLYIYSITAMGSYILPYYEDGATLFFFTILLTSVGFISTILWALFGSLFRKLFSEHGRLLNTIMALLLVYTAVSLFF